MKKTELQAPEGQRHLKPGRRRTQNLASKQDISFATRHQCDHHLIEYYTGKGDVPRCPMCAMERDLDEARVNLLSMSNELEMTRSRLKHLEVQVNLQAAIRSAIEVLDDNDYEWLKTQMYLYKLDKSVSLKPTHGKLANGRRLKRGEKMPPNGFMAIPRHGDPEGHLATSVGGLAIAEYLDEALTSYGSAQTMGLMLKAWWKVLPGGVQ